MGAVNGNLPVREILEGVGRRAGPDIAFAMHVDVAVRPHQNKGTDVKLSAIDQKWLLHILLHNPRRVRPAPPMCTSSLFDVQNSHEDLSTTDICVNAWS